MNVDRWIFRIAGLLLLGVLALSHWHHPNWLWMIGFVGLNMLQSSFTGFCPLALILKRWGIPAGAAFEHKSTTLVCSSCES